ncbi:MULTISPECIES: CoA-binding protein [Niastella]|uniref:CoA-binding protein n=1 Tax=Niastella soli TaxID=2821487 RepID=A0ABS3YM87_9BACT|nr:CoA-binding protein [Niastella soli]MBO9198993.1 CoA-binding protein [Niastella soli]
MRNQVVIKGMGTDNKKTVLLGASANPARYSFLAINSLRKHQHPVVAIGRRQGKVLDVDITTEKKPQDTVDTITLYLNPANQKEYYEYILSLQPKRIIFNPGTENPELYDLATKNGIQPIEACTLVLLSTGQY